MKINRGIFISMAAMMLLQCTACSVKNDETKNEGITGERTTSTTVQTSADASSEAVEIANMKVSEPEAMHYYYSTWRKLGLEDNESIFDTDWCLAANGVYCDMSVDFEDGTYGDTLKFISYDDIRSVDDVNDLFLGSVEEREDDIGGEWQVITSEAVEGAILRYPRAYGDGAMVFAYTRQEDGDYSYKTIYIDENMHQELRDDVTEAMIQTDEVIAGKVSNGWLNLVEVFETNSGTIYCIGYDDGSKNTVLCFYDNACNKLSEVVLDYSVGTIIDEGDGHVAWLHKTTAGQRLVRCDVNEGSSSLTELALGSEVGTSKIYGTNGRNILWTQNSVYNVDGAGETLEHRMDWNAAGVSDGLYQRIYATDDGSIFAAKSVADGIALCSMYESDVVTNSEKTVLKMAVTSYTRETYDELARFFNGANSRYEVELVEYDDSNKFITSITSKDGPDMISTDMIDLAQFSAAGYLTDMYELMDREDSRIKSDDLVSGVKNAYTYSGKLAAIPVKFSAEVIVGGEEFKNMGIWNIDELINLMERNDRIVSSYTNTTKNYFTDIAGIYWAGEKDRLVDWENGVARFDSDEFMRFLKALGAYKPPVQMEDNESEAVYWQNKQIYLHRDSVFKTYDTQIIRAVLGTEEPVYLGYPTGDKTTFGVNGSSFAISAFSDNKEGAWEFLQYLLKNADKLPGDTEFPTYLPKLNELLEEASVKEYERDAEWNILTDSNGNPVENPATIILGGGWYGADIPIYANTDKDNEELRYIFDNIGFVSDSMSPTYQIYMDEIISFMEGKQTAEQTAATLQDRMTLMIDEQK